MHQFLTPFYPKVTCTTPDHFFLGSNNSSSAAFEAARGAIPSPESQYLFVVPPLGGLFRCSRNSNYRDCGFAPQRYRRDSCRECHLRRVSPISRGVQLRTGRSRVRVLHAALIRRCLVGRPPSAGGAAAYAPRAITGSVPGSGALPDARTISLGDEIGSWLSYKQQSEGQNLPGRPFQQRTNTQDLC